MVTDQVEVFSFSRLLLLREKVVQTVNIRAGATIVTADEIGFLNVPTRAARDHQ